MSIHKEEEKKSVHGIVVSPECPPFQWDYNVCLYLPGAFDWHPTSDTELRVAIKSIPNVKHSFWLAVDCKTAQDNDRVKLLAKHFKWLYGLVYVAAAETIFGVYSSEGVNPIVISDWGFKARPCTQLVGFPTMLIVGEKVANAKHSL